MNYSPHRRSSDEERVFVFTVRLHVPLAQWIERLASDQKVEGSNPSGDALIKTTPSDGVVFVLHTNHKI